MARLKTLEERMLQAPDKQISLTDPDARSMQTRGTGIVGYNVQTAVDTEQHLIVLMTSLPKVQTEMSLNVLAYNLKRMMNIIETIRLIAAVEA